MRPSVCYLIAACSHRVDKDMVFPGKEVLKAHFRELAKTDMSALAQVTVLRALPLVRNANYAEDCAYYWDVDFGQLKCHAEVLDVEDRCFSYSSWAQAVMRWRKEFDYYVLIEDDHYPSHPQFVDILLAEHARKLPGGGFLCGFATDHASSSNGVVDATTFVECLDRLADPFRACAGQRDFAHVFCDDKIADYTDRYRCLFPLSDEIVEQVHADFDNIPLYACAEDLIRPVEYLVTGEQVFRKSVVGARRV